MAFASQLKAKPTQKKAAGKQKNYVIDSDEKTRENALIELKLDNKLEKMISDEDILSNSQNTINTGFFILQIIYIISVFNP